MADTPRTPVHPLHPSGRGLSTKVEPGGSVRLALGGGRFVWVTVKEVNDQGQVQLLWDAGLDVQILRGELVRRDAGL